MQHEKQDDFRATDEPSPALARGLIRSLTRGTAIPAGARYIHVGHERWLAAQKELLAEVAEDGHSETKFVRGAYGAGKSHFLSVVQDRARETKWATVHVECRVDRVEIDRFETLYPRIVQKLLTNELAVKQLDNSGLGVDPSRFLLNEWTRMALARVGVKSDGLRRPFDAEHRLYADFEKGLSQSTLPADFTKALVTYARASLRDDLDTLGLVSNWLRGAEHKVPLPSFYLRRPDSAAPRHSDKYELRAIGKGTATDIMKGILWLVKATGHAGLVLCIDEVEELSKLGNRKRQDQALQALREYVDNAAGDSGYKSLCMYLAATPEMFEGEDYFPRYDALATRIQPISKELNWRAPVIDLDRTPLQPAEVKEMALRIRRIHALAYGETGSGRVTDSLLEQFVSAVLGSRFRIAKPRLLVRLLVDELERARQSDAVYVPPQSISKLMAGTAEKILQETEE